jgi:hypothetical protein
MFLAEYDFGVKFQAVRQQRSNARGGSVFAADCTSAHELKELPTFGEVEPTVGDKKETFSRKICRKIINCQQNEARPSCL